MEQGLLVISDFAILVSVRKNSKAALSACRSESLQSVSLGPRGIRSSRHESAIESSKPSES